MDASPPDRARPGPRPPRPSRAGPGAPSLPSPRCALPAALALLLAALPGPATAADAPGRDLQAVLRHQSSLLDALDEAVFAARRAETALRAAEAARLLAEARLQAAEAARAEADGKVADARGRLADTLRLARAAAPFGQAAVQVLLGDDDDLARRAALLQRLTARQAAELAAVVRAADAAAVAGFTAGIERASAWALAAEARESRARLDQETAFHRAVLEALDRDPALQARAAAEWTDSAREMARRIAARRSDRRGPVDFDRLRGRVRSPLAGGRVAVPYGDVVHARYRTRTPHPGLTLEFPGTGPRNVRSVAFGKVAWVGHARGLGTTVLVDHASGWFTVYGGLSEAAVAPGALVREGDLLGQAAPVPGTPGARLYFELRRGEDPVDPRPYLER